MGPEQLHGMLLQQPAGYERNKATLTTGSLLLGEVPVGLCTLIVRQSSETLRGSAVFRASTSAAPRAMVQYGGAAYWLDAGLAIGTRVEACRINSSLQDGLAQPEQSCWRLGERNPWRRRVTGWLEWAELECPPP